MNCNIAADLIPLYAEKLCSEDTASELEKHFAECASCSGKLKDFSAEIPEAPSGGITPKKAFGKVRAYVLITAFLLGIIILLCGLFGIYALYGHNLGYMKADAEFFGYDGKSIIRNCEGMLLRVIERSIVYDDNTLKWQENFGDMSLEEFNGLRRTFSKLEIDYNSLYMHDCTSGDKNGKFWINGSCTAEGKAVQFALFGVRLMPGRYFLYCVEITEPSRYNFGYNGVSESLLPQNYRIKIPLDLYSFKSVFSINGKNYDDLYDDEYYANIPKEVYYIGYADNPLDGDYVSADGDMINFSGSKMTVYTKNNSGEVYNTEYGYVTLDAELVYRDGSTKRRTTVSYLNNDPKLGIYYDSIAIFYEDGVIYSNRTGKEYRYNG